MKKTKARFEEFLNEIGIPSNDMKSSGGRITDTAKYGSWLRKNDTIAFEVGYNEWCQNKR